MQKTTTFPKSARLLAGAAALTAGLCFTGTASAQITTLLEWDFHIDTTNNNVLQQLPSPWAAYSAPNISGNLSTSALTNTVGSQPRARMLSNFGVDGTSRGFLLLGAGQNGGTIHETMVVTTTFGSLNLSANQLDSISWDQVISIPANGGGNAAANAVNVHLLVQVGGEWFASASPFKNTTTPGAVNVMTSGSFAHTLDFGGDSGLGTTAWRSIGFEADSPLSLGGSLVSTAIGTTITGIGFYVDFRGGTSTSAHDRRVYIDNIQITGSAIPEPSSAAALAGLGVLGLVALRRRRR